MGLDVVAYKRIKKIDAVFDADGEPINPVTRESIDYDLRAYLNDDFPGRAGRPLASPSKTTARAKSLPGLVA